MFDLVPFKRGKGDIFSLYDEIEKNFLQNFDGQFPSFRTDIVDKGDRYILEADIPGFDKEDIEIHVDDNRLTITAKQKVAKEDNKDNYIRKERRYGSFTRSFNVSNVKTEEIKADYKNGVLTLDLPKKETTSSKARRININ